MARFKDWLRNRFRGADTPRAEISIRGSASPGSDESLVRWNREGSDHDDQEYMRYLENERDMATRAAQSSLSDLAQTLRQAFNRSTRSLGRRISPPHARPPSVGDTMSDNGTETLDESEVPESSLTRTGQIDGQQEHHWASQSPPTHSVPKGVDTVPADYTTRGEVPLSPTARYTSTSLGAPRSFLDHDRPKSSDIDLNTHISCVPSASDQDNDETTSYRVAALPEARSQTPPPMLPDISLLSSPFSKGLDRFTSTGPSQHVETGGQLGFASFRQASQTEFHASPVHETEVPPTPFHRVYESYLPIVGGQVLPTPRAGDTKHYSRTIQRYMGPVVDASGRSSLVPVNIHQDLGLEPTPTHKPYPLSTSEQSFDTPQPKIRDGTTPTVADGGRLGYVPLVTPSSTFPQVHSPGLDLETPVSSVRDIQDRSQLVLSPSMSLATPDSVNAHPYFSTLNQAPSDSPEASGMTAQRQAYDASATPTPLPRSLRGSEPGGRLTTDPWRVPNRSRVPSLSPIPDVSYNGSQ